MKAFLSLPQLLVVALHKRESPQEHSHQKYIDKVKEMLLLNNTLSIPDPLIGLLSDASATTALGSSTVSQPNCLQASIADVAYTNAKSSNNLEGMIASLVYRALERNTDAVGLASEKCTSRTMVNPEFTFQQHQDPASPSAQSNNKAVVLELARQISFIGGDPTIALDSGTFSPGDLQTTQGKACNDANCIFDKNLLIKDATEKEIFDYVGGCVATTTVTVSNQQSTGTAESGNVPPTTSSAVVASTQSGAASTTTSSTTTRAQAPPATATTTSTTPKPIIVVPPQPTTTQQNNNPSGGGENLQSFSGALFGIGAPAVTQSGNIFNVAGDPSDFEVLSNALTRSCDTQHNGCAGAANQTPQANVSQCDTQLQQCRSSSQLR